MKKTAFILGLIGGIFGILLGCMLLFIGFNMKVTNPAGDSTLTFAFLSILASIAGLVGACIVNNKEKLSRIFMIIAFIVNLAAAFTSISADSPINFIGGLVVAILFLISSIFTMIKDKKEAI